MTLSDLYLLRGRAIAAALEDPKSVDLLGRRHLRIGYTPTRQRAELWDMHFPPSDTTSLAMWWVDLLTLEVHLARRYTGAQTIDDLRQLVESADPCREPPS
jgi:hypothetical protein